MARLDDLHQLAGIVDTGDEIRHNQSSLTLDRYLRRAHALEDVGPQLLAVHECVDLLVSSGRDVGERPKDGCDQAGRQTWVMEEPVHHFEPTMLQEIIDLILRHQHLANVLSDLHHQFCLAPLEHGDQELHVRIVGQQQVPQLLVFIQYTAERVIHFGRVSVELIELEKTQQGVDHLFVAIFRKYFFA